MKAATSPPPWANWAGGWFSNYLGKLVSQTPRTTGNLVWPIVIVSLILKSTNARRSREAANKLCSCSPQCCAGARTSHTHAHISSVGIWVPVFVVKCFLCLRCLLVKRPLDLRWNAGEDLSTTLPPPKRKKNNKKNHHRHCIFSPCSFFRLTTICSQARGRSLHTRLACCGWWRVPGTYPAMKNAPGLCAACWGCSQDRSGPAAITHRLTGTSSDKATCHSGVFIIIYQHQNKHSMPGKSSRCILIAGRQKERNHFWTKTLK